MKRLHHLRAASAIVRSTIGPALLVAALCTCNSEKHAAPPTTASDSGTATPTNRLRVTSSVRANLGVRFADAELRDVRRTLRLPGRFEPTATARKAHAALVAGTATVHVELHQHVKRGQLLATIASPDLRARQHQLHRAEHGIRRSVEQLRVATVRRTAAEKRRALLAKRVRKLSAAGARRASLESELLAARGDVAVAKADEAAARAALDRERHHKQVLLRGLSVVTGKSVQRLTAPAESTKRSGKSDHRRRHRGRRPTWDSLADVRISATREGIVTRLPAANGAWVDLGRTVVEVTAPGDARFVATALLSDLQRLSGGAHARVRPPSGVSGKAVQGTISLGVTDAQRRYTVPVAVTLPRLPKWARIGVTSIAEVTIAGGVPEIAVPASAVVRDGLSTVVFVQNPKNPDELIAADVDVGPSDGAWVAVLSGVNTGDRVVVSGGYVLMFARSRKPTARGHFHPDGSFHAEGE